MHASMHEGVNLLQAAGKPGGFAAHAFGSSMAAPVFMVHDMIIRVGLQCCWGPNDCFAPLVTHFQALNPAHFASWRQWARLRA